MENYNQTLTPPQHQYIQSQQQQQHPINYESQFTVDSVVNALQSFYFPKNGDISQITTINHWLMRFQESFSSWEIAPLLLQSNVLEFRFFGANTIELKVKSSWNTISDDSKLSLLEKILVYLRSNQPSTQYNTPTSPNSTNELNNNNNNNISSPTTTTTQIKYTSTTTPSVILTKLCLIVSEIACYISSELWKNPIKDIIQFAFPDIDNLEHFYPDQLSLVLELLTILPEELLNSDYITQEKRSKIGREYMKYSKILISILSKIMKLPSNSSQNLEYIKKSFKCFKSWVQFDVPPQEYLLDSQLIMLSLDQVSSCPSLAEDSIHLLDELFTYVGGKIFKKYPNSFHPILEKIVEIFGRYYVLAVKIQDEKICHAIFALFSNIADNHTRLLLSSPSSSSLFKIYLEMFKLIDIESCELISHIISNFHNIYDSNVDISVWYPLLMDFVEAIRQRCLYPLNIQFNQLDKDDQEKFYSFRSTACDSLLEINSITEKLTTETLVKKLWQDINAYPNSSWQSLEATIFLLGCLSEGVTDDSFVPQLFQLISQLPIQSNPLTKSTLILAGQYANLMEKSNNFLGKIVFDFITAFSKPEFKLVASESFLSVAKNEKCAQTLSASVEEIIKLCDPYIYKSIPLSQTSIENSNINILEALLLIISPLPKENILNYLSILIPPYIKYIEDFSQIATYQPYQKELFFTIVKVLNSFCKNFDPEFNYNFSTSNHSNNSSPVKNNSPVKSVSSPKNRSSLNLQSCDEDHIILPIIQFLIKVFQNLLNNKILSNDNLILESIATLYKKALLTCCKSSVRIGPEICKQLTEMFIRNPLALSLNTLSVLVSVLPSEHHFEYLQTSLSQITTIVIDIWKKHADSKFLTPNEQNQLKFIQQQKLHHPNVPYEQLQYNLSIYPDITKEFFTLIQQFLKFNINSLPLWVINPLFQIPIENVLNIHDKTTARYAFQFLANLITTSVDRKGLQNWSAVVSEVDQLLKTHGNYLIKQLYFAIGGASERSLLPFISEIIFALVLSYPNEFRNISLQLLSMENFPSSRITEKQKKDFLDLVMKHKTKSLLTKVIEDFNLFSLGKSTENKSK